jgi:hypothetical protein
VGDRIQAAISTSGTRAFFTAGETGQLYVRDNGAATTKVSASQRSALDPNGPKPAAFMGSTPDGAKVFSTQLREA